MLGISRVSWQDLFLMLEGGVACIVDEGRKHRVDADGGSCPAFVQRRGKRGQVGLGS